MPHKSDNTSHELESMDKNILSFEITFVFHFLIFHSQLISQENNNCVYLSLQWSLVCDSAWKVHIAKFSLLVGSIFGYLVFGILADW